MRPRIANALYAFGVVGVLVGTVLPWLLVDRVVWAFDLSIWWTLTGRPGLAELPPSTGAFVVLIGLFLAVPVVSGSRVPAAIASAASGGLLGIIVLAVVRSVSVGRIHAGLALAVAGAVALSLGSLLQAQH